MYAYLKKIIFRNQESGTALFEVYPADPCPFARNGSVVCYGDIPLYPEGIPLDIKGAYSQEKGRFLADSVAVPAASMQGTKCLVEYYCDELSDAQLAKVVSAIGSDIFSFVEKDDAIDQIREALKNSPKTAPSAALKIVKSIKALRAHETLFHSLMSIGVPIDRIEILARKGIQMEMVNKNPYKCFLPFGIHIKFAEAIAVQQPWYREFLLSRLAGFVRIAMGNALENGHTCVSTPALLSRVNRLLSRYGSQGTVMGRSLLNLCIQKLQGDISYHKVGDTIYVYVDEVWEEECSAVHDIKRLLAGKKKFRAAMDVGQVENKLGVRYNKEQREAFQALHTSGIKILTGPPGSGKTTVIRGFLESFENQNACLSATTGRASAVLSNACGRPASTVNRLLNVRPFEGRVTAKGRNEQLSEDLVIVDEVSMLGLQLFSFLAAAVKSGACLVLVGDEDQLLSVEYGNVLHDLAVSGRIEIYRLRDVVRSSGVIFQNAKWINLGETTMIRQNRLFQVITCKDEDDMAHQLKERLQGGKRECQILCPMLSGKMGVRGINQQLANDRDPVVMQYGKKIFREHDKVIMTRTDYSLGYFNGDIGYVTGKEGECMLVDFYGAIKQIPRQGLHDMEHADAITIHKSEGSEFQTVHICLPEDASCMMTRRLLYTAITRAKKSVFLYTMEGCLEHAAQNTAERKRLTLLGERAQSSVFSQK